MRVLNIKEREQICKECPIYEPYKGICNPKLYLNPDTGDVSTTPKNGYIRGCGCMISYKLKNPNNHCTVGKW